MSEPLDLEMVKTRRFWGGAVKLEQINVAAVLEDFDALVLEVERLRAELARWQQIAERLDDDMEALATNLARRDEQIAAVRARDQQIISMIKYGHANEGYGTRAVQDILSVIRGEESW